MKDGENLYTTKGTLGEWANGDSVAIELVKDVDIDEIPFYVYGSDNNILDKGLFQKLCWFEIFWWNWFGIFNFI